MFRPGLDEQLNIKHLLIRLAGLMDWELAKPPEQVQAKGQDLLQRVGRTLTQKDQRQEQAVCLACARGGVHRQR